MSKFENPGDFLANSNIFKGLQYQQNFIVHVQRPSLNFSSEVTLEELTWNAMEVSTPGISLGVTGTSINGRSIYLTQERADQDLKITFLEDASMSCRRFFEAWMQLMYNPFNKTRAYPEDYQSKNITIWSTNPSGKIEYGDVFVDIFPFEIDDINYNKSGNEITKTSVNFKFRTHILHGPQDSHSITNKIE